MKFTQFYEGTKKIGCDKAYGDDITLLKDGDKYFQFIWGIDESTRWKIDITRQVYHKLLCLGEEMVAQRNWLQIV